jgi:hypothetical protein
VREVIVHLSKEEKAKDIVAISGEIVKWGFIIQSFKPSRFPGIIQNVFLSFV